MDYHKYKLDLFIFIAFLLIVASFISYHQRQKNIIEKNFTGSKIFCVDKGEGKYGGVYSHLVLDGIKYSLNHDFEKLYSCIAFQKLTLNKKLHGHYFKSNKVVVDLYIDEEAFHERSLVVIIFSTIFFSVLLWSFFRGVIKWLIKKYA